MPKRLRGQWSARSSGVPDSEGRRADVEHLQPSLLRELHAELRSAGYNPPALTVASRRSDFRHWMQVEAERSLFFFVQWVLEQDRERRKLLSAVHREIAAFLTDYAKTRRKLLLISVGHLKTTFASHGLPLHVLIQSPSTNIYFPGEWGCDQRICLANENEQKCKENLHVIASHLQGNVVLRWLWPGVCPPAEAKPKRWTDFAIEVPRHRYFPEPSVMAIGAETGFMGRHFSVVVSDDLAGIKAGQSAQAMDRAKKTQAALRTRLDNPWTSIELEVGTRQGIDDIYAVKLRDPSVEAMVRAIEEHEDPRNTDSRMVPLWPEKYPMEMITQLRQVTNPIAWSLWYMNRAVPSGYTALDWDDVREFRFRSENGVEWLTWPEDHAIDRKIFERAARRKMNPVMRLLTDRPKADSPFDLMRRQQRLGLEPDQSEHLRLKYAKCAECGAVYATAGGHDCVRAAPRTPDGAAPRTPEEDHIEDA